MYQEIPQGKWTDEVSNSGTREIRVSTTYDARIERTEGLVFMDLENNIELFLLDDDDFWWLGKYPVNAAFECIKRYRKGSGRTRFATAEREIRIGPTYDAREDRK
jgi:hypothetical protein